MRLAGDNGADGAGFEAGISGSFLFLLNAHMRDMAMEKRTRYPRVAATSPSTNECESLTLKSPSLIFCTGFLCGNI